MQIISQHLDVRQHGEHKLNRKKKNSSQLNDNILKRLKMGFKVERLFGKTAANGAKSDEYGRALTIL